MENKQTNDKNSSNESFPWKQLRVPLIFIAVTLGIAIWIMFARIWPANIIIKAQLNWFDGYYYPKATIVVIWISLVLIIALTGSALSYLFSRWKKPKG